MKARVLLLAGLVALAAGCSALLGINKDFVEGAEDASVGSEDGFAESAAVDTAVDTSTGEGGELDGATEAAPDASCAGHFCQGVCLTGTSCAGCIEGNLLCAATHTCVSACTGCAGSVECWACPGGAQVGSCEPSATAYCFGAGYTHCPCAGGLASACPGATQTCKSLQCSTCGEPNTDGTKCKNGLDCAEISKSCR